MGFGISYLGISGLGVSLFGFGARGFSASQVCCKTSPMCRIITQKCCFCVMSVSAALTWEAGCLDVLARRHEEILHRLSVHRDCQIHNLCIPPPHPPPAPLGDTVTAATAVGQD